MVFLGREAVVAKDARLSSDACCTKCGYRGFSRANVPDTTGARLCEFEKCGRVIKVEYANRKGYRRSLREIDDCPDGHGESIDLTSMASSSMLSP
jgi:hypothetical protein